MHAESSSVSWAMVAQLLGPGDPGRSPTSAIFGLTLARIQKRRAVSSSNDRRPSRRARDSQPIQADGIHSSGTTVRAQVDFRSRGDVCHDGLVSLLRIPFISVLLHIGCSCTGMDDRSSPGQRSGLGGCCHGSRIRIPKSPTVFENAP